MPSDPTPVSGTEAITIREMWIYLALEIFLFGLVHMPLSRNYWEAGPLYGNTLARMAMTGKRFFEIRASLKFSLNHIYKTITEKTQLYYTPSRHVSVDELLLPFKGRYRFRQHVRGKPNQTGLKYYCLVDSKGVVYAFWLYQGEQPPTKELVMGLVHTLPKRGYVVHTDTYFGGAKLAEELQREGKYFTMACRSDRPSGTANFSCLVNFNFDRIRKFY